MRVPLQPWMTCPETRAVMDVLNHDGDMARFVGGCVRSAVLDLPIADVDIATRHLPEETTRLLREAGIRVEPTGLQHGTVTAVINHEHFEITTLRLDVETDGRRAVVAFTDDWREDAARRDFTMNAMFLRPDGTLDDPFGGHGDALSGRVRFVGDPATRIQEDVLRILRFFRFHAYYGKDGIDPTGLKACAAHAEMIDTLSGERIRVEFLKLLSAPEPEQVLEAMEEAGIFTAFLPGPYSRDDLVRLREIEGTEPDALLRLAAFAPERDGHAFKASKRMRFSNAQIARFRDLSRASVGGLEAEIDIRRAIYTLGNALFEDAARLAFARGGITRETADVLLSASAAWPKPELPVRGKDIMEIGLAAGPGIGEVLKQVENWWIGGNFEAGRETALAEARRIVEREHSE